MMSKPQYGVGDVVLVKCSNSDYWPAKIIQKDSKNHLHKVNFYNLQSFGRSTQNCIQPYNQQSIKMIRNIYKHLQDQQRIIFETAMNRAQRDYDQILIRSAKNQNYQSTKSNNNNKIKQQKIDKDLIANKAKDKKVTKDYGVNEFLHLLTKNDTQPLQYSQRQRLVWTYAKKMFSETLIREIKQLKQLNQVKANKNKLNPNNQLLKIQQQECSNINSSSLIKESQFYKKQNQISQSQFEGCQFFQEIMLKQEADQINNQITNVIQAKSQQDINAKDYEDQYQKRSHSYDNLLCQANKQPTGEQMPIETYNYETPPLKRKNKYLELFSFQHNRARESNLSGRKPQKKQIQLQLTRPLIDQEKQMFVFMNNYSYFLQELTKRLNSDNSIRSEVIVSVVENAVQQLYNAADSFRQITEPQKFSGLLQTLQYIFQNKLLSLQELSLTIIPKIITFLITFQEMDATNKNIQYTVTQYIYLKAKYQEWLQVYETQSRQQEVHENLRERTLRRLQQAPIKGL